MICANAEDESTSEHKATATLRNIWGLLKSFWGTTGATLARPIRREGGKTTQAWDDAATYDANCEARESLPIVNTTRGSRGSTLLPAATPVAPRDRHASRPGSALLCE